MVEQFRYIASLASMQLNKFRDNEVADSIRGDDFKQDFMNEEYVTKNVRVNPFSGPSVEESKHESKHQSKNEEPEFEEGKMNQEI